MLKSILKKKYFVYYVPALVILLGGLLLVNYFNAQKTKSGKIKLNTRIEAKILSLDGINNTGMEVEILTCAYKKSPETEEKNPCDDYSVHQKLMIDTYSVSPESKPIAVGEKIVGYLYKQKTKSKRELYNLVHLKVE